jgi:hypothetical protein
VKHLKSLIVLSGVSAFADVPHGQVCYEKGYSYSNSNTACGAGALLNNSGDYNSALGTAALGSNTSGLSNNALGFFALSYNTTGDNNIAIGNSALGSNTTGNGNTATGPLSSAELYDPSQAVQTR